MDDSFDVLIVGGGVVGCAVARELSRFRVSLCVVEKGGDVASGVSKANSGVIHSGINSKPGSLKAKMCMEGNRILPSIAKDLKVPFSMSGKIVIAKSDDELGKLEEQESWGRTNGVPGMQRIDEGEIRKMEPNITGRYGLWVPTAGIIPPYSLTIALAESAAENGAKFLLETKVVDINAREGTFDVETSRGRLKARSVVNSAGLHCDDIAEMVGLDTYSVYPSRGEYHILDKEYSHLISRPVYPVPPADCNVLGVHLTTTMEGNILVGPSAEFISDKDDTKTTREVMDQLIREVRELLPSFPDKGVIKSYSGVRCKLRDRNGKEMTDFVIEEEPEGFINLMGIESPGLTGSPAIANMVREMIAERIGLVAKERFNSTGYRYVRLGNVSMGETGRDCEEEPGLRRGRLPLRRRDERRDRGGIGKSSRCEDHGLGEVQVQGHDGPMPGGLLRPTDRSDYRETFWNGSNKCCHEGKRFSAISEKSERVETDDQRGRSGSSWRRTGGPRRRDSSPQARYPSSGCREKKELGGLLDQCIHDGFGLEIFKTSYTGPEYAQKYVDEAARLGIETLLNTMVLDLTPDRRLLISNSEGLQSIKAKAVILAMGCRERTREAIGIPGTRPSGIYTAGAAQAYINLYNHMPGERVVILGSGNVGLIMARRLTLEGAKVLAVLEILPYSSGLTRNIVQCLNDFGIPLYLSHTITDISGPERVSSVTVAKVDEGLGPINGTEWKIE